MIDVVLKIGGRLGRGEKLEALCQSLTNLGRRHRILVVPGGGAFADTVRDYDVRYQLSNSASHWMAILAMDQFGHLLSELIPGSEPVRSLPSAGTVADAGKVPVLIPFDLLWRKDPLAHSWSVTSDAIAAWVAELVRAHMLILLKTVDGLYGDLSDSQGTGVLLDEILLEHLAVCKGVDGCLASLLEANDLELWIINGEKPDRVAELLDKGHTKGTHLKRSFPSVAELSDDLPDR
jgi:hypothetical protein